MSSIFETTATVEDAYHLKLDEPLQGVPSGITRVLVLLKPVDGEKPSIVYPEGWRNKTPEERAAEVSAWVESHNGNGVGLSDWAISRDSIYD